MRDRRREIPAPTSSATAARASPSSTPAGPFDGPSTSVISPLGAWSKLGATSLAEPRTTSSKRLVSSRQTATGRSGSASDSERSDAGNRWVFNDQLVDGLEPWGGVRQVWAGGSDAAQHGVDTTDTFDKGVESLAAHAAYIEGLGWENWDPREFLEGFGRQVGQRMGVAFGAAFEVFSMQWEED